MKKILTTVFAAIFAVCQMVKADGKIYLYGEQGDYSYGFLNRVSENGRWVVGADDGYNTGAYIIDTTNPSDMIHVAGGELYDVANNGMAVGAWYENQGSEQDPIYYQRAAIYRGGQWTRLPEPLACCGRSYARCVSPDGKYIGGMAFCYAENSEVGGKYYPCVWTADADGYYDVVCYNNLKLPDNMGLYVNDMTADGRTLVGMMCTDAGGTVPVIVKDGKLLCWNKIEVKSWPFELRGTTQYYDTGFVDDVIEGATDDGWFNGSFAYINGDYVFGHRTKVSNVDVEAGTGTFTHYRTVYNLATGEFMDEPSDTYFSSGFDDKRAFIVSGVTAYYLDNGAMRKVAKAFNLDSDVDVSVVYGSDSAGRVFACSMVWFNEIIGDYCESPALIMLDAENNNPSTYAPSYNTTFDTRIPKDVVCENLDGGTLRGDAYRASLANDNPSWFWGKTSAVNASALCPTRNEDGSVRRSRMIFPAVNVANAQSMLRWDARSMAQHIPESYRVLVRKTDGDWTELCAVNGENYAWTTRTCSLAAYVGSDVQIAFESATSGPDAFMLAVDDVAIGTIRDCKYKFVNNTKHYVTPTDDTAIVGQIINYGAYNYIRQIVIEKTDGTVLAAKDIDMREPLRQETVSFSPRMATGETIDYRIVAVTAEGNREVLCEDYISCSYYRRTLLMDRLTGTWCNNCPQMDIAVAKKKVLYGDELIVAELHVDGGATDVMACPDYWSGYYEGNVFSIPQLLVNHNKGTVSDKIDYVQTLYAELRDATIAKIGAKVREENGMLHLTSECEFGMDIDNSTDRYRVGYIVLRDIHQSDDVRYGQSNSPTGAAWEEYYYMPDRIAPDLVWHKDVVVEASTAVGGIASSLGTEIKAGQKIISEYTLSYALSEQAAGDIHPAPKVVAVIIDTADGRVVNCSLAKCGEDDVTLFPFTVSPSNETPVKSLSGVVAITFPTVENIFMSRKKIYLYDGEGNPVVDGDGATVSYSLTMGDVPNVLKFNISSPLTENGTYTFVIPRGSLLDDDTSEQIPEIRVTYIVDAGTASDGRWKITPSLDEPIQQLDGTYTVTLLDYAECGISWDTPLCPCNVFIYKKGDDMSGRPLTYYAAAASGNEVTFTAQPGLYDAGEYMLNVSGFVRNDTGDEIPGINIPFTLTGGVAPDNPEDPKLPLDETYILAPGNSAPVYELSGRIKISFPNIPAFEDVGGFPTITEPSGVRHGVYADGLPVRIKAHYDEDGEIIGGYIDLDAVGLLFTEPGTYTFSIPGDVFHVDDDVYEKRYVDAFDFSYVITDSPQTVLLEENFDGDYSENFPCSIDVDSQEPSSNISSWFLSPTHGYYMPWWVLRESSADPDRFMGSHSYYSTPAASDDWFVSRPVRIPSEGFLLDFDAQSVVLRGGDRLSDLSLFISEQAVTEAWRPETPAAVFEQVPCGTTPDVTTGEWTRYSVSLDEWAGKTVYICFVNRNMDKDLLCIDNVKVYRKEGLEVYIDELPTYTADEKVTVTATVTAVSEALKGYVASFNGLPCVPVPIECGQTRTFSATFSLDKCERKEITFSITPKDSHEITRTTATTRLAFKPEHRVLIEETTGLWCGNCPIGVYNIESLKEDPAIGDAVLPVSVHISGATTDLMAMDSYAEYLGLANVAPMTRVDRGAKEVGFSAAYDANYDPTNQQSFAHLVHVQRDRLPLLDIEVEATPVLQGVDTVAFSCEARVTPAINLDPERYRVGFILTENNVGLDGKGYWAQQNYFSGYPFESKLGGWTELGSKVQNLRYHYVARALPTPSGIEDSFTELDAEHCYTVAATITIPDTYKTDNKGNLASMAVRPAMCEITAYIVDTEDLSVQNSARVAVTPDALDLYTVSDMLDGVNAPEASVGSQNVYDLQGRRVSGTHRQGIYIQNGKKILTSNCMLTQM